ncbi:MAG TPA: CGNR zinc finger domain-containing protein [Vicinamibacterales bacterium]|nr:CGNR zinc finger domain-containing protein [Vicinamibacterales bacterium]
MRAPASLSSAPALPWKFVGGDLSLDFVNTVDWTPAGPVKDRLVDIHRLVEWGKRASVLERADVARLSRVAQRRSVNAQRAYERARWGRWVLQRLYTSIAEEHGSKPALDDFNELRRLASARRALAYRNQAGTVLECRSTQPDDLDAVLWAVVGAAERLLVSSELERLRVCAGRDCGWLYVDRSRNGLRRWCDMATCGTIAKSQRRAARRNAARSAPRS